MKNEILFIGQICQAIKINHIPGQVTGMLGNYLLEYFLTEKLEITGEAIDETLLKKVSCDTYVDLQTKKIYKNRATEVGKFFIREESLRPINEILEPKEKGKNLSKRRALKRYNEVKKN